jgi:hypothetical protein
MHVFDGVAVRLTETTFPPSSVRAVDTAARARPTAPRHAKDQETLLPVPRFQTTPGGSRAAAIAALAAATVALGACGSSSGASSTSAQQPQQQGQQQGGGPFASLSASARACVEKQGVTLPNGRRPGNGQPPNGQAPNGQAPNGQPGTGTGGRPANSDRFAKMRAALKKCGVNLPNRPPGGGPPQGAGGGTGTSQNQ